MNKITFPLNLRMKRPEVGDLQDALQLLLDQNVILRNDEPTRHELSDALKKERIKQTYGIATRKAIDAFQKENHFEISGVVDENTANALNKFLQELPGPTNSPTPLVENSGVQQMIEGRILLEHGMPAKQLKLRLYRRDFGGKSTLLNETTTFEDGQYAFTYDSGGMDVNLEVHAVKDTNEEIPLSQPLNYKSDELPVPLNLIAPGALQPLAAEYHRLAADLTPHIVQMTKLTEVQENAERQDLTVLNSATGWDARLISLAATAERLNADPEVKLSQEALYGLLRAGLPSDKMMLAQIDVEVVEQALQTVREAGIVELNNDQIGQFKNDFITFANKTRLNMPTPGSHSTYGDFLKASNLNNDAQAKFASVYHSHGDNATKLWEEARKVGLEDTQVRKLQLQGKLAFLTGNSAAMTSRLMEKQIEGPVKLLEKDFHRNHSWVKDILDYAGIPAGSLNNLTEDDKKKLDALIPAAYTGDKVEDRLNTYAEDMARKVRLSYPTHVIGRLIEQNEIKVPEARDATVKLLANAAGQGFRLGETPVATFFNTHSRVRDGISDADFQSAQQQIKTLQRVYQVTPSNESMQVLLSLGMTSAYDVMAYPEVQFVELFNGEYLNSYNKSPISGLAALVYRKAKQVSSVTYNLFTIAQKIDSEPQVAAMSATAEVRQSVRKELIKHFPTMESLFGSMDFCECEHCRSVLSPAAYLVDLLQFIDTDQKVWKDFLAEWKKTHDEDYPHKDKNGNAMKPYDVLVERRPDLPYIALTCENTNTALPYIDIVNEILEYCVANGKLEEKAAHNIGETTTAELLAEPQNVVREAYKKLNEIRYPLNLPFDLWIETVRQFCNYFDTPLSQVLEVFRQSDDLFAATQPLNRFSIFMESLGLSPAEVAIFTNVDPLTKWYELYGFNNAAEAITEAIDPSTGQRIDLNSAKALSRCLGVTYKEMTEIVQTGFVNPKLVKLSVLYKLGISIHDARFYLDHKALLLQEPSKLSSNDRKLRLEAEAISNKLLELAETFQITVAKLENELSAVPFNQVLVLADPDTGCNFDQTTLRYSNGNPADAIAFLKINLFVRLWRKLGWTIEETDCALQAFVPKNTPFEIAYLSKKPLKTALVYLAHLKALDERSHVGKNSRIKLITLWSDIATTGKKPLYAQLFLTPSVLKSSPIFADPLGQYLSAAGLKLKDHMMPLQGSLGLTADDISQILKDAGKSLDIAELSLPNVSLLYRYGLLAKAFKLSVRELIALKQLSGLDPFKQLHSDPLEDTPTGVTPEKKAIDFDYSFSNTLRFVEVVEKVKQSGLKIEDLEYLLLHRFDETGKYRPNSEGILALLKTIAEGILTIRKEHAVPKDPNMVNEETLRQKLGLIFSPDVVERFLSMMNGTAEFTATKKDVKPEKKLKLEEFADEPTIREVSYNETLKVQKLTFRGVLFDAEKTALKARFPNPDFGDLLDDLQLQARSFFEKYLQKQIPDIQPATGFLDATDFDLLFDLNSILTAGETEQERICSRRKKLAEAFLPFLQKRLIRQYIVQTMTAYTSADPSLVESLITDERLLARPEQLLEAFTAAGECGVNADFFDSIDESGVRQSTSPYTIDVDTALKDKKDKNGNPLNPANSARFDGYLEVPLPGAYRFYVSLNTQGSEVEMYFHHLPDPLFLKGKAEDNKEPNEFLELKSGVLYPFSLNLKKLNGSGARLLVQGENLPKGSVSQLKLYPLSTMKGAEDAIVLLTKVLQLVQSLGLSEREIRYFLTHPADFEGMNLSQLPTQLSSDTLTELSLANKSFAQFLRLADYSRLKSDLASGTDDIIDIFEANGTGDADKVYSLIAKITRRDKTIVKESINALYSTPGFDSNKPFSCESSLQRLWDVLQIVELFGVQVVSLLDMANIVSNSSQEQRFLIAHGLKEVIKARFEPETWQRVAQPIFDKLRQRQRDALVSYVIRQCRFSRMEQLYEYFLIDPGMEPVVQTSRIRLAISSVQLFIQLCLLNMELKVHPSVINSNQWEWMKRYRIWEANRKIFLFPENWLEPEFRDDKTHLFRELEGSLLQGDVSNDLVEDAFLNYLRKLDELARLDIVAMHMEDDPDPARRSLHVIGRTYSQPHKYFYRRYIHQAWTPWEPVSAEVEGDHLAPVIWRNRLYLFWLTFKDKANENAAPEQKNEKDKANGNAAPEQKNEKLCSKDAPSLMADLKTAGALKELEVQLHWSEYLQGVWSTSESSGFIPVVKWGGSDGYKPQTVETNFDFGTAFVHVSKAYEAGEERGVYVHLSGSIEMSFYLEGRNSSPESRYTAQMENAATPVNPYISANKKIATCYSGTNPLNVSFQEITTEQGNNSPSPYPSILQQCTDYKLLPCNNNITALGVSEDAYNNQDAVKNDLEYITSLMKPVFYKDNAQTFFIEPNVTEQTIEEWKGWITCTSPPDQGLKELEDWSKDIVIPQIPKKELIPDHGDPWSISIDPGSRLKPKIDSDWLVNPGTGLLFDGELIGPGGRAGVKILPSVSTEKPGIPININPGSSLPSSSTVVIADVAALERTGLKQVSSGLNVVGSIGFNSELRKNFNEMNSSRFSASLYGAGKIKR